MPVYLLQANGLDPDNRAIEAALKASIPELRSASSIDTIGKSMRAGDDPIIAIAIVPDTDRDQFNQLVEFAVRRGNQLFLILIGSEISVTDYKLLVRTGAVDWVEKNAGLGEVLEIIARRRSMANVAGVPSSRVGGRPVTISFIPSAGGVGNTTLAVETAAYIKSDKASRDRTICLVDLDFQTSHTCDYLDSEPRLLIADFSSAPERLDEHLLESFKTRHSSGIDVFAAPRSKFFPESLNINALDALFSMIAMRYELVLIIYPLYWLPWTAQIIAASDGVIVTGTNTIPCLRLISETLAHVRTSGTPALQVRVAINRCERTLLGAVARRRHAEMALRDEQVFFIGNRPEAVESVNMGVPMVLGAAANRVRREFAPVAAFCAGLQSSHVAFA
jgi:Flp pilus assembly CpaE family ATPase